MKPGLLKSSFALFIVVLLLWTAQHTVAETYTIQNTQLAVRYDQDTKIFSLAERTSGKLFLPAGRLEGDTVKARVESIRDSVFGAGRRIRLTQADGSTAALELYPGLPFLLVRKEVKNSDQTEMVLPKVGLASFRLDLGRPASELRTMGTAGLLSPDKNPGSYLFLTCADPATRRGVVAGWVTEDRGSGVLFSDEKRGLVEFRAQIDYGNLRIAPGNSAKLETLAVGFFDDARVGQELFASAIQKQYRIQLRPKLAGYCTWYSEVGGLTDAKGGRGSSNEKDIRTLTEFAARELKPFGFDFIQIDDEWQDGATKPDGSLINGPRRGFTRYKPDGGYPHGMAPVASMIRENGFEAGIWFLPFARNHQDPEYQDQQDWFMKRLDGTPYETVWGGTSLDLTHPKVKAHLREVAQTLRGWGFNYFKMDGLWTGSVTEQIYVNDGYQDDHIGNHEPFHDPRITNIEALRSGLKLLRDAAGPDVFFSGCNLSQNMRSLAGTIGLVDSMRVGPDNGFEWQDYRKETMHFEGGGIITGPIRGNRLYFLNGRVWWNDPDPSYVRPAVKLNHAQLLASWIAVSGGFALNSDWLPGLPPERLNILKRCLPSHGATSRPVDYFDSVMPGFWLVTDDSQSVRRDVLGLYNWESTPQSLGYDAAKAGLDPARSYYAFDFWANKPAAAFAEVDKVWSPATPLEARFRGSLYFKVPAESCRIIALRADEGHPVLVSTSRHVTQGIVDVSEERWQRNQLSATSKVVANDAYELRIAGVKKWKIVSATISASDRAAGATIEIRPAAADEAGWARLVITSPDSRAVKWSVKFEPDRAGS